MIDITRYLNEEQQIIQDIVLSIFKQKYKKNDYEIRWSIRDNTITRSIEVSTDEIFEKTGGVSKEMTQEQFNKIVQILDHNSKFIVCKDVYEDDDGPITIVEHLMPNMNVIKGTIGDRPIRVYQFNSYSFPCDWRDYEDIYEESGSSCE